MVLLKTKLKSFKDFTRHKWVKRYSDGVETVKDYRKSYDVMNHEMKQVKRINIKYWERQASIDEHRTNEWLCYFDAC